MTPCPCCGSRTGCRTCPVCYWTDDPGSAAPAPRNGPNGTLSLDEAKLNFAIYGASQRRYQQLVRPARPEELPLTGASGEESAPAHHAVVQIERAEARPVACRRPHVGRADGRAGGVELERDVLHPERIEQLAAGESQHVLRMAAHGVADDPRKDQRARAAVVPATSGGRDQPRGAHDSRALDRRGGSRDRYVDGDERQETQEPRPERHTQQAQDRCPEHRQEHHAVPAHGEQVCQPRALEVVHRGWIDAVVLTQDEPAQERGLRVRRSGPKGGLGSIAHSVDDAVEAPATLAC